MADPVRAEPGDADAARARPGDTVPVRAEPADAAPTDPVAGAVDRMHRNPVIGIAALFIVIAGLRAFGGVLGPVFLALVLVVTVDPVAAALGRRGFPRWVGAIVTLVLVYAILLALVAALVYAVSGLVQVLPGYRDKATALLANAAALLQTVGIDPQQVRTALSSFDIGSVLGFLQGLAGQVAGLLSNLALVLTLLLFLALDATSLPERLQVIGRNNPDALVALRSFALGTRKFLLVATIFGLMIAVLDVAVLWLLGIPLALLIGVLALFGNYIPSIGFLLALVPAALLALLEGGPGVMLVVVIAFSVINVVLQTFVQPRFVGQAVGLSVSVTFLSLVFWGWVIGPLGALLAVPLTLLAKALLVDLRPQTRWIGGLISARPGDR